MDIHPERLESFFQDEEGVLASIRRFCLAERGSNQLP
jgi:hypothetical protein